VSENGDLRSSCRTAAWVCSAASLVILPVILYCLLALPAPLYRLAAWQGSQLPAINLPQPDLSRELELLAVADPYCAAFETKTHAPIYEIDTLKDARYSYDFTGTTSIVINKARLPTVELRTLAISHELFHASHHFVLVDLVFPEESQAHRHTQRVAAALHVHPPTEAGDRVIIYAPTVFLVVALMSSVVLWLTRPTVAEYRRLVYKSHAL
jgi:hypothetical protein